MTSDTRFSRRNFLIRSSVLGCSLAASPLLTPVTFAAAPWDNRLVVIILRGGMDGLDVVQPYGDRDLAGLRKSLKSGEAGAAADLDGFFSLHAGLSELMGMWQAGELAFAHAVSTPYRNKRSHFDGQDLLEAGTDMGGAARDGWLNRLLQVVPGVEAETGYAIGREELLVLTGAAEVANWSPDTNLDLSPQARRLLQLVYHDDPLFRDAAEEALELAQSLTPGDGASGGVDAQAMQEQMVASLCGADHRKVAEFAAGRLRGDTRVAAFSINGWDTHGNQRKTLQRPLTQLKDTLLILKEQLGDVWGKTAVLAMTEFGRTARENGTRGTDHGTGGAMLLAGGAVKGGRVYANWPGLSEQALYQRRDLNPTEDVRAYAAMTMAGLFGLDRATLEGAVFPGLDMGQAPQVIL